MDHGNSADVTGLEAVPREQRSYLRNQTGRECAAAKLCSFEDSGTLTKQGGAALLACGIDGQHQHGLDGGDGVLAELNQHAAGARRMDEDVVVAAGADLDLVGDHAHAL